MDDQQLLELLQQIQDLAGVAIDSLTGGPEAPGGKNEQPPAEEKPPAA